MRNKVKLEVKSETELVAAMIEHSKLNTGVWVAHVLPFGSETYIEGFASPSRIPDAFLGHSQNAERGYAINGEMRPFSKAALIREQNRAINCDK